MTAGLTTCKQSWYHLSTDDISYLLSSIVILRKYQVHSHPRLYCSCRCIYRIVVWLTGYIHHELVTLCECVASLNSDYLDVYDLGSHLKHSDMNINCDPLISFYKDTLIICHTVGNLVYMMYLITWCRSGPIITAESFAPSSLFKIITCLLMDMSTAWSMYVDATDTIGVFKASYRANTAGPDLLKV